MMQICLNCGREFEAKEDEKFDKIHGCWVKTIQDICNNCKKDLETDDDFEIDNEEANDDEENESY